MQKYFDSVIDTNGKPVNGATVRVNQYPGGGLATIYSDDGVTQAANPVTTNAKGYYEFYAANGRYTLTITDANGAQTVINDVRLEEGPALEQTLTWDPGSIADGDSLESSAITVTGATLGGGSVEVIAPYSLQGLTATAYISAADTVKVVLDNATGAPVDLDSGVWRVLVRKRQ